MENVVTEIDTKKNISANLSKLLKANGWSQGELARRIFGDDITVSNRMTVSRWVRGESLPSSSDLLNLAEAFDLAVEEIARPAKRIKKTA
jgi:transcriptional regulator with XRE-family HTH domain